MKLEELKDRRCCNECGGTGFVGTTTSEEKVSIDYCQSCNATGWLYVQSKEILLKEEKYRSTSDLQQKQEGVVEISQEIVLL